ncbi:MAG: MotA/TolQ/ExbB proton channel family protein [Pirellulales bacterium]
MIGIRGGRFTRVHSGLTFVLAALATVAFYGALTLVPDWYFTSLFTERGPIPYAIVFLTMWCLAILAIKRQKLKLQRKALQFSVVPDDNDFVLSTATVEQVMNRIYETVDDPRQLVLFNRIVIALANLQNMGRVTDVDEILRSQGDQDASMMETSYSLLRGFIWAIPVLGFIGTVLGLSDAIGGFGSVLGSGAEMNEITGSLKEVTAGLAVAFDTTLEALVAALVLQIVYTFLHKSEEEFLDSCSEYCHRNIVNRLRIMPYQQNEA